MPAGPKIAIPPSPKATYQTHPARLRAAVAAFALDASGMSTRQIGACLGVSIKHGSDGVAWAGRAPHPVIRLGAAETRTGPELFEELAVCRNLRRRYPQWQASHMLYRAWELLLLGIAGWDFSEVVHIDWWQRRVTKGRARPRRQRFAGRLQYGEPLDRIACQPLADWLAETPPEVMEPSDRFGGLFSADPSRRRRR